MANKQKIKEPVEALNLLSITGHLFARLARPVSNQPAF